MSAPATLDNTPGIAFGKLPQWVSCNTQLSDAGVRLFAFMMSRLKSYKNASGNLFTDGQKWSGEQLGWKHTKTKKVFRELLMHRLIERKGYTRIGSVCFRVALTPPPFFGPDLPSCDSAGDDSHNNEKPPEPTTGDDILNSTPSRVCDHPQAHTRPPEGATATTIQRDLPENSIQTPPRSQQSHQEATIKQKPEGGAVLDVWLNPEPLVRQMENEFGVELDGVGVRPTVDAVVAKCLGHKGTRNYKGRALSLYVRDWCAREVLDWRRRDPRTNAPTACVTSSTAAKKTTARVLARVDEQQSQAAPPPADWKKLFA